MLIEKLLSSVLKKDEPKMVLSVPIDISEDGTVDCDVITILFGMGQMSRKFEAYIPHTGIQEAYDMFYEAICQACDDFAENGFNGIWQVWGVNRRQVETEKIEEFFKSTMTLQPSSGENEQPSST